MDRWSEDASTETGRSNHLRQGAEAGLSSFVKASHGAAPASGGGQGSGITIQPSKRAQAVQAVAARLAATQAQGAASGAGAAPGSSKLPAWATEPPPPGMLLQVIKDGAVLQEVPLTKPATVLGRSPAADLMLDHQSISRQHAAICWHAPSNAMVLLDLGSVHGSWADGKRADAGGQPLPLAFGSELRLGASTRKYVLRRGQQAQQQAQQRGQQQGQEQQGQQGLHEQQQEHKRAGEGTAERGTGGGGPSKRVRFAGEGSSDGDAGQLEQVIGYAERGSSFSLVGPRPVKGQEEGRFAALVQSTTLPRQQQGVQNGDQGRQREGAASAASPRAGQGQAGVPWVAAGLGVRSAMQIFNQQLQQKKQQQQQQQQQQEQAPEEGGGGAQQLGEGAAGGGLLFAGLPPPKNG